MLSNILVLRNLWWSPNLEKMLNWGKLRLRRASLGNNYCLCAPSALHSQIACGLRHFLEPFRPLIKTLNQNTVVNTSYWFIIVQNRKVYSREAPSQSEIIEEEDDDVEGSTPIRAPAKESALSSPGDPFLFCGSNWYPRLGSYQAQLWVFFLLKKKKHWD